MLLFAWTAAFAILAVLIIGLVLVGLRIAIVCFAGPRTRPIWDALFALIGLAIAVACFGWNFF